MDEARLPREVDARVHWTDALQQRLGLAEDVRDDSFDSRRGAPPSGTVHCDDIRASRDEGIYDVRSDVSTGTGDKYALHGSKYGLTQALPKTMTTARRSDRTGGWGGGSGVKESGILAWSGRYAPSASLGAVVVNPATRPPGLGLGTGEAAAGWRDRGPFLTQESPTLQVQAVLYLTSADAVDRSLASLSRAAELAVLDQGRRVVVSVKYGDCSPLRSLEDADVSALQEKYASSLQISYEWFGENLGSARGHNRLARGSNADFLMTLNPDVVVSPRAIQLLVEPFTRSGIGVTEAKQLPIEHPKDYSTHTGETSWAATACAVTPRVLFEAVGGFDEDSFFMYCDDVDYSWSVRRHGLRVIYQPAATVFHDKRLGAGAAWEPTSAERYYSAEAALILFYKWSREDLLERALRDFEDAEDENYRNAAAEFRQRVSAGRLPAQVDSDHEVGIFDNGFYARHRYAL